MYFHHFSKKSSKIQLTEMSYLGSPYSNSYNQDYEYEDDNFDDEDDRENEDPHDESDEG